ncbi:MAG: amidohydrolase family protein [Candidatus Marinimicrobia bacterium]|nr:amidohydrolase family protein [Candidatus Neomarinimicrobiota bacterium]
MRKILRGAKIIDCVNPRPLEGYEIIIKGDSILSINKKMEQELPGDEVINLSGKTMLPGLINMHVHLTADDEKNLMPDMLSKSDEQLLLQAVKASRLSLKSGVTTVRDCGSRNNLVHRLREAINQGKLSGPRIVSSGMAITITGGSGYFFGIEADGADEIRKAVRLLVKDGSDFIKIMLTGAECTPSTDKKASSYTDQELYAAVDEAHRHGRKVAAHAHGTRGIRQAVKVGVDTIEHCSFLTDKGMKAERDVLKLIKEKEIIIVPTISGNIRLVYEGPFTLKSFDKLAKGPLSNHFHERFNLFKDVYKSGVTILAGNDAGTNGTPHDDFVSELEMMTVLGMETKEVINIATRKAANALELGSKIGTIEVGKKADLLVVEGNPLQDIKVLRNPYLVMAGGKRVVFQD